MKIALFFGSFNPIHIGHLIIGNTLAESQHLDQVWFVVSPHNPFKQQKTLLHEFDRFDMVELATQDNDRLRASDIEFHLPKPSYTIDTLTYMQEKYPQHQFALLMGSDNLSHFHKWKNYDKILEYYRLYVYPRPHREPSALDTHSQITFVEAPLLDISATYIRQAIRENKSIQYLVPESVENYIRRKNFYL
ncbi:MAG: nicotinate-nucleotide adenylyltransferase [Bacteroidia bacterium]|nr:nicotinate-nucleotide adenylyltransferase [Bacteroidia bacterium]